jgi:hypothetical protein
MSDVQYTPPPPPPPPAYTPPPPAVPTVPSFDFGKPFTYVFDDPNWIPKILIGGLFYLAGFLLIGWFFIFGYVAQTARNVMAGHERPLPEWENIGAFFAEGLRLFAVLLVYILPMIVLAMAFIIPAGVLSSVDHEGAHLLGEGIAGCLSCLMVPLVLIMMVFAPASMLFAAAEQRFGAAFEFGRIWDFIKANAGNYILAICVYLIARFLAGFGIALLCVGVIFTGFWSFLITAHGFAQVWRLAKR